MVSIYDHFLFQVIDSPNSPAICMNSRQISYLDLNTMVEKLSLYLEHHYHVSNGDFVALFLSSGESIVIAILAVLRLGAAYVPVDQTYPKERVRYILEDTQPKCVITDNLDVSLTGIIPEKRCAFIDFSNLQAPFKGRQETPKKGGRQRGLAYVIYTSGSTGKPKGVMIAEEGVLNLCKDNAHFFNILDRKGVKGVAQERVLAFSNYVFDAHVWTLFTCLLNGHTLYIPDNSIRLNIHLLKKYIETNHITIALLPPSLLEPDLYLPLKTLILGGEKVPPKHLQIYHESQTKVFNAYGPTEATVMVTVQPNLSESGINRIGKPIEHTEIHLFDQNMEPTKKGEIGEIFIGGKGVAQGYINHAILTEEKFLSKERLVAHFPDFRSEYDRFYKTGDLARIGSDGSFEFIGRKDSQLKIRGYRIEIGEIETALNNCSHVKRGIVITHTYSKEKERSSVHQRLVAFYIPKKGKQGVKSKVLAFLKSLLPDYMIPSQLIELESFPVNLSGKINMKALNSFLDLSNNKAMKQDFSSTEHLLRKVWANILKIPLTSLGKESDFFELGGNSLLAMRMGVALSHALKKPIFSHDILRGRTLEKIADILDHLGEGIPFYQERKNQLQVGLSKEQYGVFFIEQLAKGTAAYHIPIVLELSGINKKDLVKVHEAVEHVIYRHEILRTIFRLNSDKLPFLHVIESFKLPRLEVRSVGSLEELEKEVSENLKSPFNLHEECLIRLQVFKLKRKYYLSLIFHHIIFDGYSVDVLMKEISDYVWGEKRGKDAPLPFQYRDFSLMEEQWIKSKEGKEQLDYWVSQLSGFQTLDLPLDYSRTQSLNFDGRNCFFQLDKKLSKRLKALAQEIKVSLFSLMLSAFYLLLEGFCQQQDLVVGVPFANRNYPGVEALIGYFVNVLPIRCRLKNDDSLYNLIKEVNEIIVQAHIRQSVPFQHIVNHLDINHEPTMNPVFQVMFGFEQFGQSEEACFIKKYDLKIKKETYARLDLSLFIDDGEESLKGAFNFATALFKESTIQSMVETYTYILEQFSLCRGCVNKIKVSDIQYVENKKTEQPKPSQYPSTCVHHLFEQHVLAYPDDTAIISNGRTLSYFELNIKANQLARYLKKNGAKKRDKILFSLDDKEEALIAMLAILKLGATYIPIDPAIPQNRFLSILEDLTPALILLSTLSSLEDCNYPTIPFDLKEIGNFSVANLDEQCSIDDLAYIIYTSGSTGNPKGVMIKHVSVTNYIHNIDQVLNFFHKRIDFSTNVFVDLSVTNTLAALCFGGIVCVYNGHPLDLDAYQHHLQTNQVEILKLVPSYFSMIVDRLKSLPIEAVVLGGEKLLPSVLEGMRKSRIAIFDEYGPTEATVGACISAVLNPNELNIGYPYPNMYCFILDDHLRELPAGAKGELYLGGVGIAKGYINQRELTQEKFIPSPFDRLYGERLYRTGDIVKRLDSGALEYIGRKDQQIKMHGYRIELGEIEHWINQHPKVEKGVVEFEHKKQVIWGFYQTKKNKSLSKEALKDFLKENLPIYMIPSQLIELKEIKLSPSGKISRNQIAFQDLPTEASFPQSDRIETVLKELWSNLLHLPITKIGSKTPFFQMGGTSILLIRLKDMIESKWGEESVSIADLFRYPTIKQLGAYLYSKVKPDEPEKESRSVAKSLPRSHQIAVIGLSGSFSGASSVEDFWTRIEQGEDLITRKKLDECKEMGIDRRILEDSSFIPAGGLLERFQNFDPEFWDLPLNDAKLLHPQVRKFLEHSYHALEHAGSICEKNEKTVGVFAGMTNPHPYYHFIEQHLPDLFSQLSEWEKDNLIDQSLISMQTAYHLGLKGPAVDINTACSTSLAAIIEACKSLRLNHCDLALAGGVSLTLPFRFGDLAKEGLIFSKRGKCAVFDQSADGTVRGSGVGVVVLKRLEDAQKDEDHIIAIIEGFGMNNDGHRKVGFTAPSPEGQSECIQQAIEDGDIDPNAIQYIECHGTGTQIGDPIEIEGIKSAFVHTKRDPSLPCFLGGVKANIGHCDKSAGIAGFIKACMMIDRKKIPQQIHFKELNSRIPIHAQRFVIPKTTQKWPSLSMPVRVGVSSFGIGGTNAHVIIKEAELSGQTALREEKEDVLIFPFSGKTLTAFKQNCQAFLEFLSAHKNLNLKDLSVVLQSYREHFLYRKAFVCKTIGQLMSFLREGPMPEKKLIETSVTLHIETVHATSSYFAAELYTHDQGYKSCVEKTLKDCAFQVDLESAFKSKSKRSHLIPFILTYSYGVLLNAYGVEPDTYSGRGLGKIVALCLQDRSILSSVLEVLSLYDSILEEEKNGYCRLKVSITSLQWNSLFPKDFPMASVILKESEVIVEGSLSYMWGIEQQLMMHKIPYQCLYGDAFKRNFDQKLSTKGLDKGSNKIVNSVDWLQIIEENKGPSVDSSAMSQATHALCSIELGGLQGDFVMRCKAENGWQNLFIGCLTKDQKEKIDVHLGFLSSLWEKGLLLKWNDVSNKYLVKKLSGKLPKYQFETKECWIEANREFDEKNRCTLVDEQFTEVEEAVGSLFCEVLGCEQISKFQSYFELGGDSLSALRLAKKISETFDIRFSSPALFRYHSVVDVSQYIEKLLKEETKPTLEGQIGTL